MKKGFYVSGIVLVSLITTITTFMVFKSRFAKLTIDLWSFGAALFLISEGIFRIITTSDSFWPRQFMRFVRIIIGVCVFTIHTCQMIYGI